MEKGLEVEEVGEVHHLKEEQGELMMMMTKRLLEQQGHLGVVMRSQQE